MNKDRLLRLADLLEKDAVNPTGLKFDLSVWGASSAEVEAIKDGMRAKPEDALKEGQVVEVNCGTAACAVGLAVLSGAFTDEGLGYRIELGTVIPTFDDDENWDAVSKFFGINNEGSYKLFSAGSYPIAERAGSVGELAVAKRIRDAVADKIPDFGKPGSYWGEDQYSDDMGDDSTDEGSLQD